MWLTGCLIFLYNQKNYKEKYTEGVNHVLFTQHRRFQDGSLREPIVQRANEP